MNKKVKIVLVPDANHVQLLKDTMKKYFEICNNISQRIFEYNNSHPFHDYYWESTSKDSNSFQQVRREFPDINTNMITMAFRRVGKAYKKKKPTKVLKFSGAADYNSFMIMPTSILKAPHTIGIITISTLAGYVKMHIEFEESQREKVYILFSLKRLGMKAKDDYKLTYHKGKFYLARTLTAYNVEKYYQDHYKNTASE